MEKVPNKEVEIQPLGSYLEVDSEGYIINPASLDKIQEQWKPVVDEIVEVYKSQYGEHLKSVYVRGSVAKGQAVENISDIDSFCYTDIAEDDSSSDWEQKARNEIKTKFPFVEGVELSNRQLPKVRIKGIFLNQSICVYGEPIEISKIKPGKDMMFHIPNLERRIEILDEKLENAETEESIKNVCVWFAKDILRTGFELTMDRSKRYTRDRNKRAVFTIFRYHISRKQN